MTATYCKEVKFWSFKDHPNKPAVIAKNREWHVDIHDWWDFVYEQWARDCGEKGFSPDLSKTFFRGFWSQGDGAAFYGLDDVDLAILLKDFKFKNKYTKEVLEDEIDISIQRNGYATYYCHENTFYVALEVTWSNVEEYCKSVACDDEYTDDHLRLQHDVEDDLSRLDDFINDIFTTAAKELYQMLENEYDALTSDSYLAETFEGIDDIVFDLDGNYEHLPIIAA